MVYFCRTLGNNQVSFERETHRIVHGSVNAQYIEKAWRTSFTAISRLEKQNKSV